MDFKTMLAATPWLRRAWKYTPAPLRGPLIVIGGLVLIWYLVSGRGQDGEQAA